MVVLGQIFEQLINIFPRNLTHLKTCKAEFPYIEIWFTEKNSAPLQIKIKVNLTWNINSYKKMRYSIKTTERGYFKSYVFASVSEKKIEVFMVKKPIATVTKTETDALKTASKRVVQKPVAATGDSISSKTAEKVINSTWNRSNKISEVAKNVSEIFRKIY